MIVPSALHPLSALLALGAAIAYVLAASRFVSATARATRIALVAAWLLHLLVIGAGLLGPHPEFGFGPALSITAWLVMTVYGIELQVLPRLTPQRWLMVLGALSVVLGVLFPGQPLHDRGSPWMAAHLALGIASYGLFAAAVVHGWLMQRAEKQMRSAAAVTQESLPLLSLERLTFRFAQAGFVLLSATLIAGLFFGEQVYGRAWAWRHKEVFSVLAWLAFAALLAARWRMGLRGKKAIRLLNIGSLLLLLAYAGSRFVMEVVLRS